MKRRHILIHSVYWVTAFFCFTLLYSFIGSIVQGVIYASISLPMIMGVTYFFIYWAVPNLLFESRYTLFFLVTATIFLLVLNIQIVFAQIQRIFLTENLAGGIAFVHWDVFYLMTTTILFSLPAITYETLRNWTMKQKEITQLQQDEKEEYIEVKSDGKTHRIASNHIHYIESYGDYAYIHLAEQTIITRMTLKKLDELLSDFVRVHRSYIVNPDYCKAYNLDEIIVGEKEIPIGRTYKDDVSESFNQKQKG